MEPVARSEGVGPSDEAVESERIDGDGTTNASLAERYD